jgi:autotransporter-associated beta strand protein
MGTLGLTVTGNKGTNDRDPATRGTLNVGGYVRAGDLSITAFFPNTTDVPYVTAGEVNLLPGGVLEVNRIVKNDRAYSHFNFKGGTLKARASSASFASVMYGGHLYCGIDAFCEARFDTAGYDVTFNAAAAGSFTSLTGDGGLRKLGAGTLTFTLAGADNTFTGNIVVEEGTLNLGRPLAQGQLVTVHGGAAFIVNAVSDIPKITYLASGPLLFTVGANLDTLDLTAYAPTFHTDRIGGPFSGTATLSGLLTYDSLAAGSSLNPFRLVTQGGTLCLTNTGLESAHVLIDGPGTMEFQGDRVFTPPDAGKISFTADGQYQQRGLFTMTGAPGTPATFTVEAPARFATVGSGNALEVGVNGDAVFVSSNAMVSVERLRVGGQPGTVGAFAQDGGKVTLAAESWIGYDSGTGTLHVANGEFRSASSLRIAANTSTVRTHRSHGVVSVTNGLIYATQLNFTPWFPTDTATMNAIENELYGEMDILAGGLVDISDINKNDSATSLIRFGGGTLRIRNNGSVLAMGGAAVLKFYAAEGNYITLEPTNSDVWFGVVGRRIALTGPGGFKKLGNGIFGLYAHQSDYLGDTVVEGGMLRLVGPHVLPCGPGKGNLVLNAGTVFDLRGHDQSLNSIEGPGRIVNSDTNGLVSTLGLLADGTDGTWSRIVDGPFALNKLGGGTLTMAGRDLCPHGLTVSAGTVRIARSEGYPFYRFKVEGMRDPGCGMMQFWALGLYDNGVNIVPFRTGQLWDSGYSDDVASSQTYPGNEQPPNVLDGQEKTPQANDDAGQNRCTKWLDFRISAARSPEDRDRVWIRVDYPSAQKVTHYNWATANDSNPRDPTAWRLQGSYDGTGWTDLSVMSNVPVSTWRYQWASGDEADPYPIDSSNVSGRTLAPDAPVAISGGASLILDGVSETIGNLSGMGSVTLDGGDLTVNATNSTASFFAGDISGSGSLIKAGSGTQIFSGVNTFTGDFIVQEGVAEIEVMPASTFDWFRFTVKDNRGHVNVLQYSEFALYDANGTRTNMNLTQGLDAASLNPGEVATLVPYQLGNGEENILKLFDGDLGGARSKWCPNNNTPTPSDPETWRAIVLRLAAGSPEIVSYNLATANDESSRDPVTWVTEGSPNGKDWFLLDAQSGYNPTTGRGAWYNGDVPFPFNGPASLTPGAGTLAIPAGSVVEVQAGATLAVTGGAAPISALRVDMIAGAGTITRFTPAPNGTLHLTRASGNPASWTIPLTLGTLDDSAGNLRTWQVIADGVLLRGYTLALDTATGMLKLLPQGTMIILK